ncbi:unnamed protein product [Owenia fusiformis]|uniref:Tripartite motif-containing protein 3 n=1 Tax=Owenia fusiformis TaxID=6347 RepID=A0A8S4MZ63_OWEFU|nr:unnamed protein product [Owenia fusiformis]
MNQWKSIKKYISRSLSVTENNKSNMPKPISGKVVASFETENKFVSSLATMASNDILVTEDYTLNVYKSGGKQGGLLNDRNDKVYPWNVAVFRFVNEHIAMTCCAMKDGINECVKIYNTRGHLLKSFGQNLIHPRGLAVNSHNQFVVTDSESRNVYIYDADGCLLHSIDHIDYNDEKVFQHPLYVAINNSNYDIIVSDCTAGCVKVFDCDGRYRFTYNGKGTLNPRGVCSDKFGNIFITDWHSDSIHMINSQGLFQRCIVTKNDGIEKPQCLVVNETGNLVVGEYTGHIKTFSYLSKMSSV